MDSSQRSRSTYFPVPSRGSAGFGIRHDLASRQYRTVAVDMCARMSRVEYQVFNPDTDFSDTRTHKDLRLGVRPSADKGVVLSPCFFATLGSPRTAREPNLTRQVSFGVSDHNPSHCTASLGSFRRFRFQRPLLTGGCP